MIYADQDLEFKTWRAGSAQPNLPFVVYVFIKFDKLKSLNGIQ